METLPSRAGSAGCSEGRTLQAYVSSFLSFFALVECTHSSNATSILGARLHRLSRDPFVAVRADSFRGRQQASHERQQLGYDHDQVRLPFPLLLYPVMTRQYSCPFDLPDTVSRGQLFPFFSPLAELLSAC
jgi:hypothetical protein